MGPVDRDRDGNPDKYRLFSPNSWYRENPRTVKTRQHATARPCWRVSLTAFRPAPATDFLRCLLGPPRGDRLARHAPYSDPDHPADSPQPACPAPRHCSGRPRFSLDTCPDRQRRAGCHPSRRSRPRRLVCALGSAVRGGRTSAPRRAPPPPLKPRPSLRLGWRGDRLSPDVERTHDHPAAHASEPSGEPEHARRRGARLPFDARPHRRWGP